MMDHRLLARVVLRNYKSIAACDVSPAQPSFLVGPDGSGKSNFLDALSFVADALRGHVADSTIRYPPVCTRDNLYLRNVSGLPEFRPACDALIGMAMYNLDVGSLRALQPPEPAALLKRNGSNLASVLRDLGSRSPGRKEAVEEYMAVVVPGLAGVDVCPGSVPAWRSNSVTRRQATAAAGGDCHLSVCGVGSSHACFRPTIQAPARSTAGRHAAARAPMPADRGHSGGVARRVRQRGRAP